LKYVTKYASIIYLFSNYDLKYYLNKSSIKFITNGIDFAQSYEYKPFYNLIQIKILYVGKIKIDKGFIDIIKAFNIHLQ